MDRYVHTYIHTYTGRRGSDKTTYRPSLSKQKGPPEQPHSKPAGLVKATVLILKSDTSSLARALGIPKLHMEPEPTKVHPPSAASAATFWTPALPAEQNLR